MAILDRKSHSEKKKKSAYILDRQKRANTVTTSPSHMEDTPEEANRKWEEAFANTTEEEFDALEKMIEEDEEKYGTMPLDFAGR